MMFGLKKFSPHQIANTTYRDPNYSKAVFHGAFDNANSGNNKTYLDSSTNNWTVTRNGNPYQGSVSPFSPQNWSNEFVGSNSTSLTIPGSASTALAGDFTIEGFIYINGPLAAYDIIGNATGTATYDWSIGVSATGALQMRSITSTATTPANLIKRNKWHNWAITRVGSTLYMFVDGVLVQTYYNLSQAFGDSTRQINIGAGLRSGATNYLNGFIHGLRWLSVGFYNQTYQVTTIALKAITNTVLLTCCSNRFEDLSQSKKVLTPLNGPLIRPNSPLAPKEAYSVTKHAGSLQTTTGDYLTVPNNSAFRLAAADFTLEGWFYPQSLPAEAVMISKWNNTGTLLSNCWILTLLSGVPTFLFSTGGTTAAVTVTGAALQLNAWSHIAVVRNNNVFTLFVNGVPGTSVTNTGTNSTLDTEVLGIGYRRNNGGTNLPWIGYMSQLRLSKNVAIYPNQLAFIPPTTPLTATSGTTFLFNFTNAQLVDLTASSNITTAGTATSSTLNPKYGSGALLISGAGSLLGPSSTLFGFGTADFTIVGEIYLSTTTLQTLVSFYTTSSSVAPHLKINAGGLLTYATAGIDQIVSPTAITASTWHEFAVSRINGITRLFLDGLSVGSPYTDTNDYGTANPFGVGDFNSGSNRLNGNIDNLLILKGVGLYAANYTPLGKAWALQ